MLTWLGGDGIAHKEVTLSRPFFHGLSLWSREKGLLPRTLSCSSEVAKSSKPRKARNSTAVRRTVSRREPGVERGLTVGNQEGNLKKPCVLVNNGSIYSFILQCLSYLI